MVSFDRRECKDVFDALVMASSGELLPSEALDIVDNSGVEVKSESILKHIAQLRGEGGNKDVAAISKEVVEEKKEEIKEEVVEEKPHSLFKEEKKEDVKEESKQEKGLGSLFGKNNNFSSNSRNKEKTKQDAVSIGSAIEQLDEKQGYKEL